MAAGAHGAGATPICLSAGLRRARASLPSSASRPCAQGGPVRRGPPEEIAALHAAEGFMQSKKKHRKNLQ